MQCPDTPKSTPQTLRARLHQIENASGPRPDIAANSPTLCEVFPTRVTDPAGAGFVVAHLPRDQGPILWIQDRLSLQEAGRPYLAGHADPPELLCLTVNRAVDVLWAMEQGLDCSALGAVVGEVWGDAPALDFTATKRLALRAEAHARAGWLLRRAASPDLSAARERWRIRSAPSDHNPLDSRAPGNPRWHAHLFRARWRTPGTWVVSHDTTKNGLHFEPAAPEHDPALPAQATA